MIRQLSIALTEEGEVGDGTNLLFTSNRDFKNFSRYTAGTAMIMGFNTAQQLLHSNVQPTARRPWVVVSGDRLLRMSENAHVYYVDNVPAACNVAEAVVDEYEQLLGWTLIGGVQLFEAVIQGLGKSLHLTSYYMCRITGTSEQSTGDGPFHALSVNAAQLELLLKRNMIDAQTRAVVADVLMLDSKKEALRLPCAFKHVTDKGLFDQTGIDARSGMLIVNTTATGRIHLPFAQITHYVEEKDRLAITVYTKCNTAHTIRLEQGEPGLNYLKLVLDQNINH